MWMEINTRNVKMMEDINPNIIMVVLRGMVEMNNDGEGDDVFFDNGSGFLQECGVFYFLFFWKEKDCPFYLFYFLLVNCILEEKKYLLMNEVILIIFSF